MEKNGESKGNLRSAQKIFRRMKILAFFMLVWLIQVKGEVYSQNQLVTLQLKNCNVEEFLQEVKNQTGIRFMYRSEFVRDIPRFSLDVRQERLDEVLEQVFAAQGIRCRFEDEVVILMKDQAENKMREIRGTVRDAGGNALPGVTVLIKGTSLGTATDADGKYALKLPEGNHVLIFTMVGMESREEPVDKRTEIDVVLKEEAAEIDEVVVTGIFKKARESYTGSVSTISSDDLKVFRGQNLLQTLKNADVSLNFAVNNAAGSNPNARPRVNIRGNSSLPDLDALNEEASNTVNEPLVILDGFEISLERLMDYNDEEIESINILKDAAATAIYGSRGSNGVIVIITKEPEEGKLRVNAEVGIDMEVPDLTSYDLLNAEEKLQLEYDLGLYDDENPRYDMLYKEMYNQRKRNVLAGATTDWIAKPIRTGVGSHYNLRLEGGSEQFRWSVTTNYKNVAGAMKNSYRRTFNGGITLVYKVKNLIFKNYTSYGTNRTQESNYGSFSDYVAQQPWASPYDENGNVREYFEGFYGSIRGRGGRNPLYDAMLNTVDKSGSEELTDNFAIEWNIVEGMTLRGQFGITTQNNHSDYFLPANHSYFTTGDNKEVYETDEGFFRRGRYTYGSGKNNSYSGNVTLSYSKLFRDKHLLYVGLDYSVAMNESTNYSFVFEGFSNENMNFIGNAGGYEKDGIPVGTQGKSRRLGFTGNVNYTYDGRYYVDASARVDGSSTFGSDKKYAPFWSVGLGWNLHSEQFLKGNEVINNLRLKVSYGQTGSQQGSGSGASTLYAYQTGNRYLNWTGASLKELGNPRLTWQTTDNFNIGAELGLWNGRIKAEFDFYTKKTANLLSNMDLPHSMGLTSYVANVGEVKNRGWEASLGVYAIRDTERELSLLISGQLTYDKNWVSKLSQEVKKQTEAYLEQDVDVSNLLYEGNPQNAIYAIRSLGIDPSTGKELFLTREGDITDTWKAGDKVYLGQKDPRYRGNLNAMLTWKKLTFNMSFYYYWGGKTYNQTLVDRVEVTTSKLTTSNVDRRVYTERWMNPGDVKFFKGFSNSATRASSRFVMPDNVLELSSVSLQYRWDTPWIRKYTGTQSITFGVNMNDLFHWGSTKFERGTDYPFARNIQANIRFLF